MGRRQDQQGHALELVIACHVRAAGTGGRSVPGPDAASHWRRFGFDCARHARRVTAAIDAMP
jgi:hypothetical protein